MAGLQFAIKGEMLTKVYLMQHWVDSLEGSRRILYRNNMLNQLKFSNETQKGNELATGLLMM
jgi:hypothetical protein